MMYKTIRKTIIISNKFTAGAGDYTTVNRKEIYQKVKIYKATIVVERTRKTIVSREVVDCSVAEEI